MKQQSILISLACLLVAGVARADIYAFTDEQGTVHFSDVPQDRRYVLFLRTPREPAGDATLAGRQEQDAQRARYSAYVEDAAKEHRVGAALLHAVISAESGYNPNALSRKGAIGLMQLMPETARRYDVADPYDPVQNIRGGTRYLRDLLKRFNNDLRLALAAYNAGEDAVIRHGNAIPPFPETVRYVPKVMELYGKFGGAP